MKPATTDSGVRVLQVMVVLAVVVVLAGVVAPLFGGRRDRASVEAFLARHAVLRQACQQHRIDCGTFAIETGGVDAGPRQLSSPQPYAGWRGPYLEGGAAGAGWQAPGVDWHVCDHGVGFDLDADGKVDVPAARSCNVLRVSGIDVALAGEIDAEIDRGVPTGRVAWEIGGRVRYDAARSCLLVLLTH